MRKWLPVDKELGELRAHYKRCKSGYRVEGRMRQWEVPGKPEDTSDRPVKAGELERLEYLHRNGKNRRRYDLGMGHEEHRSIYNTANHRVDNDLGGS